MYCVALRPCRVETELAEPQAQGVEGEKLTTDSQLKDITTRQQAPFILLNYF